MPELTGDYIWVTQRNIKRVLKINVVAAELKKAVQDYVAKPAAADLGVSLRDSDAHSALSFALDTPYGEVRAVFDHVMRDNAVLGRCSFKWLKDVAKSEPQVTDVWSFLFDTDSAATLGLDAHFTWTFFENAPGVENAIRTALLTLLAHIHLLLPQLDEASE
ncbi:hypothetical protein [Paraburkholderia atlantica]|uniref:hypothetical protein n=1 Tax=Paraburkholderia atlantica TaxID=2654982 RepID=UPI00161B5E78|nr:hypothetical protein [Paraburkholderia atlantica]MBB5420792.1 hypothetical protein [Paraburkholderia atlantica]